MFSRENMNTNQKVGNTGENIAVGFLESKGFTILERNYWKKWGEIDVIARKGSTVHFVEVKTISRENILSTSEELEESYMPEDNMHHKKIDRLQRTIQSYLLENRYDFEWQLDLVAIRLFIKDNKAKCVLYENVL